MNEYKEYWLTDFGALIAGHMHSKKEHSFSFTAVCTCLKKARNKFKGKFIIQSIGIMIVKKGGHLLPAYILVGIKFSHVKMNWQLQYLRVYVITLVSLLLYNYVCHL